MTTKFQDVWRGSRRPEQRLERNEAAGALQSIMVDHAEMISCLSIRVIPALITRDPRDILNPSDFISLFFFVISIMGKKKSKIK